MCGGEWEGTLGLTAITPRGRGGREGVSGGVEQKDANSWKLSLRGPAGVMSYDVPTFTENTKCCTFIKVEDSRETD